MLGRYGVVSRRHTRSRKALQSRADHLVVPGPHGWGARAQRPATGLPAQNAKRFEQADPRPRPTPPATVLGSRGVAGGRAASAPPLFKAAVGAFRGRGVTTRKTRARASSLGGLRLGSRAKPRAAAPPFWPRCRSASLREKRQGAALLRRRACASAKTR